MTETFMENRVAPIEPVNFGIHPDDTDALVRAYQYLADKTRMLSAPGRAIAGGVDLVKSKYQDTIANVIAGLMGKQRPDPNAATAEAVKGGAYSGFQDIGNAGNSLMDAMASGKEGIANALGWKDAVQVPTAAAAGAPVAASSAPNATTPWGGAPNPWPGALPPQPQRIAIPKTPGGALPDVTTAAPAVSEEEAARGGGDGGINQFAPRAPESKQVSLRDQFLERLAKMDKHSPPEMTAEQKGQALMEAGLAIMSFASRPGSSALGAIGHGGMQGTAVAREMQKINREQADKARSEERANIGTEFTLAGQDEDRKNWKQDKAEDRDVRRQEVVERSADREDRTAAENRRIRLMEKELRLGKRQAVENDSGTYTLIDTTGQNAAVVTGVKARHKDERPSELIVLDALKKDPSLMTAAKELRGDKNGISDKDIIAQAVELTKGQTALGGTEDVDAVLRRNIEAVSRAAGRPVSATGVKKIATQAEFDALPKGTEYVGPDGKKARK